MKRLSKKEFVDMVSPYLPDPIITNEYTEQRESFGKIRRAVWQWGEIPSCPAFIEVRFDYDPNETPTKNRAKTYCIFCTFTERDGWKFQELIRSY